MWSTLMRKSCPIFHQITHSYNGDSTQPFIFTQLAFLSIRSSMKSSYCDFYWVWVVMAMQRHYTAECLTYLISYHHARHHPALHSAPTPLPNSQPNEESPPHVSMSLRLFGTVWTAGQVIQPHPQIILSRRGKASLRLLPSNGACGFTFRSLTDFVERKKLGFYSNAISSV